MPKSKKGSMSEGAPGGKNTQHNTPIVRTKGGK